MFIQVSDNPKCQGKVVAYGSWSLTKAYSITGDFGFLENWLLKRGSCLPEVVATGGLTVFQSLTFEGYSKTQDS